MECQAWTCTQTALFFTLCEFVDIIVQISGSYHSETTAHEPACVASWQSASGFQQAPWYERVLNRETENLCVGVSGMGGYLVQ